MTAQELLQETYTAFRGKIAAKTPAWGSAKADIVLQIANRKIKEWAKDSNNVWASLFDIKDIEDPIDTAVLSYDLDASFMFPSDFFIVEKTNGDKVNISITSPQERLDNPRSVYISSFNPKKVSFAGVIDTGFDGGTLKTPGYYMPDLLAEEDDVVPVDDPNWLVYAVAAELARNDAAKQDEFPNLIGMANDLYTKMAKANRRFGFKQGRQVAYNMQAIGDSASKDEAFE